MKCGLCLPDKPCNSALCPDDVEAREQEKQAQEEQAHQERDHELRQLSESDREEIQKFQDFLQRWGTDRRGVLQDPSMQEYLNITPQEAQLMMQKKDPMTDPLAKLVDRFLAWPLPQSVCSDLCVTMSDYRHQRVGTNLLTADEARQMLEYLFDPTGGPMTLEAQQKLATLLATLEQFGIHPITTQHKIVAPKPAGGPHLPSTPTTAELAAALHKFGGGRTRYYYDDGVYFLHPVSGEGADPNNLDFHEDAGGPLQTPPGPITPVPLRRKA